MKNTILVFISSIFLLGCGELFMVEEDDSETKLNQFATCKLDVTAFSYILERNIKGDILCLKENLHLFMDTVKTDRPGYISKDVLKNFILEGPLDIDEDIVNVVDSVFDLSHIMIGTERDYIIRTDVDVLLDFLVFFNEHIWKSYKFFISEDSINYAKQVKERQIIFDEFALIAQKMASIYRGDRDQIDRIDTEQFVFNFFKKKHKTLERIRSLMFLKRAFLGGEVWSLTHQEFGKALEALPYLAQVAFDVAKVQNYEFANKQEVLINIFLTDIDILKSRLFYDSDSHESVFTVYDIINAITTVAPDLLPIDIEKYPRELMKIKDIILGNGGELISANELLTFFDHSQNILEEAELFYRVYNYKDFKDELNSGAPITHDFKAFPLKNSREDLYLRNFSRIVHDYKFMKGSLTYPYYTYEYHRNANSFFQTSALEYGVKLLMAYYGDVNFGARGGFDMTLKETVTFIDDFKWFLKDYGIINIGRKGGGEVAGVADNLVLMSTLFQYQSNGCDSDKVCMETPELTEFVIGLMTAVSIKDFFTETMLDYCASELDEHNRIAPDCFRRNFINVMRTKMPIEDGGKAISEFMPLLDNYMEDMVKNLPEGSPPTESEDYMTFITETENFTRSCTYYDKEKTDEVFLKANDAFAVFTGLLNVESTLLRFDLDQNNTIDAKNIDGKNEVYNAYKTTYKGALIAMVSDKFKSPVLGKFLAKPVFEYLVKYGDIPDMKKGKSILKFIKIIFRKYKKGNITRATVATILKVIGQQSENAALHPYKCEECFRDPTVKCLPEGDPWE